MKKKLPANVAVQQKLVLPPEFQSAEKDVAALCPAIKADHERFVESARSALQTGISCGRHIWCAKELAGHGRWERLFAEELQPLLGFDLRNAQRYLAMYASFTRFVRSDTTIAGETLNLSDQLVTSFKMHWAGVKKIAKQTPNEWVSPPDLLAVAEKLLTRMDCDPAATVEQAANCPAGKTRNSVDEFRTGSMSKSVLMLPAAVASNWPAKIMCFPMAITRDAPYVLVSKNQRLVSKRLPCRLLLVHLTKPDLAAFQAAINDTLVGFCPSPNGVPTR